MEKKKKNLKKNLGKKTKKIAKKILHKKIKKSLSKKIRPYKDNKKVIKKIDNKTDKVSTGIPNLDKITDGGFRKNSTNLIIGEAGSGKTILGTQFLIEWVKKGYPCLFISFEESKDEFYANMKEFGWDLETLEKKGKFFFLQYSPGKVKSMLEEGGGTIENLVLKEKINRIVIDSITSFMLLLKDDVEKRESTLMLFNLLRKWNSTSILTYEGNPKQIDSISTRVLKFESDSIILLYFLRGKNQRNRYLEVVKMRGSNHSKKIYQFEIDKGILLRNNPISGEFLVN